MAVVGTINEAREAAESDLRGRMRRLELGEDAGLCPALYKVWAREIDSGYRLACEITDLLELRVSAPSRQAPPGCGRRCILAPAFPLDQPQLRRPVDERAAQPFHVRMPRAQLGIHSRDLLPAARDSRCLLAFPGDFRDDNLPLEHHHRLPSPFRLPSELPCSCRRPE